MHNIIKVFVVETRENTFGVQELQNWIFEARTLQLQKWANSEDARLREENRMSNTRLSQSSYIPRRRQQEQRQKNRDRNELEELGIESNISEIVASDVRFNARGKIKKSESTGKVMPTKTKNFAEALDNGADVLKESVLTCVEKIRSLEILAKSFHSTHAF